MECRGRNFQINQNWLKNYWRSGLKKMKIYKRNCPKCEKELITNNKYWNRKAIIENRTCLSCGLKGKPKSDEARKNMSINHADVSGKNNPFYGKKHTAGENKRMVETRSNHPTWKHNASAGMKRIWKEYWTDKNKNPMDNPKSVSKIRLKRIDEIKRNSINGQISPNYNPEACRIIDNYGKENGYNFQHAENGGEFHIKELGYWVDGYDEGKNVVIEYYEKWHKDQTEKDKRRKQEIIDLLGCEFIEIKE